MNNLKLIVIREYLAKVKNKTFVTMTFVSPLIFVGMVVLIAYLTGLSENKVSTIAFHDESGRFENHFHDSENLHYVSFSNLSLEAAIDSTKEQNLTGLLHIPKIPHTKKGQVQFFADGSPDADLIESLESKLSEIQTNRNLTKQNIDLIKLQNARSHITIDIENYTGERSSKISGYIKMIFGGAAGYLLMMFIIIYGNMVMRSVIEEKVNRIIEIIISSVKPIYLMIGKIVGTTLAGVTQFLIWLVIGGILLGIASFFLPFDVTGLSSDMSQIDPQALDNDMMQEIVLDISNLPLIQLIICFFIYFIGGYFLYSAIYAAIGAAVDNETDTQQFMLPIIVPLMLAMYVGFFSVMNDPHGTVAVVFSHIPLTSPIVMLMRIPFGVPWWEVTISILILVLSILAVVWVGAKIYRVGILMYGKKPSFKELAKWLKY